MDRIGHQLLDESHARIRASGEKSSSTARDLLSLLVKANMSPDIGEHHRMTDSDVLARKYIYSLFDCMARLNIRQRSQLSWSPGMKRRGECY